MPSAFSHALSRVSCLDASGAVSRVWSRVTLLAACCVAACSMGPGWCGVASGSWACLSFPLHVSPLLSVHSSCLSSPVCPSAPAGPLLTLNSAHSAPASASDLLISSPRSAPAYSLLSLPPPLSSRLPPLPPRPCPLTSLPSCLPFPRASRSLLAEVKGGGQRGSARLCVCVGGGGVAIVVPFVLGHGGDVFG